MGRQGPLHISMLTVIILFYNVTEMFCEAARAKTLTSNWGREEILGRHHLPSHNISKMAQNSRFERWTYLADLSCLNQKEKLQSFSNALIWDNHFLWKLSVKCTLYTCSLFVVLCLFVCYFYRWCVQWTINLAIQKITTNVKGLPCTLEPSQSHLFMLI